VIEHGKNGWLTPFFDVERLARTAAEMLEKRAELGTLRAAARETIVSRYDLQAKCLPALISLLEEIPG
jgi:hypothetical protein